MVMVIPDSGNITGSQPVLRQSSTVTPMSDTRVETMDTAPVADSLKNLGKAYVQFKEQENLALGQQLFNDYNEHIAKFQLDWENNHKKYAARGYYQALKEESWKFFNNRTGDPKNDGKIRTNEPDQKAAFQAYIEKRQPDLISHAMAYEASELTAAQNASFDAADADAVTRILAANGDPVQTANALADIDRVTAIRDRGHDQKYIRLHQAEKRDVAMSALVMQTVSVDPVAAAKMMDRRTYADGTPIGNPQVYDNLTSSTEAKLRAAIKEAAGPKFKSDELLGNGPTIEDIMFAYNTNNAVEAKMIRDDITAKALKEKATIDKEAADARQSQLLQMRDAVENAQTPEEKISAMERFADRYPAEAQRFIETQSILAQDRATAKIIDDYDLDDYEYIEVPELSDVDKKLMVAMDSGDRSEIVSAVDAGGSAERVMNYKRKSAQQAQQEAMFQRSPVSGIEPISAAQIQMVKEYEQRAADRVKNLDKSNDALRRINQGENVSYEELTAFDPTTVQMLSDSQRSVQRYNAMSADLRMGGINLDQLLLDTSYADFKNRPDTQIMMKDKLATYINEHKKHEGGYPTEEDLKRYVDRALANSKTSADDFSNRAYNNFSERLAGAVERAVLRQKTSGKTDATSFDKRFENAKNAIESAMDDVGAPQHVRRLIRKNMDNAAYSIMSGKAASDNFFNNLLRDE